MHLRAHGGAADQDSRADAQGVAHWRIDSSTWRASSRVGKTINLALDGFQALSMGARRQGFTRACLGDANQIPCPQWQWGWLSLEWEWGDETEFREDFTRISARVRGCE